jgi:hypothetical protein
MTEEGFVIVNGEYYPKSIYVKGMRKIIMKLKYKDIKEGTILYEKWREVKVIDKNEFDKSILVQAVNQPSTGPEIVGAEQLSDEPLHCWKCQKVLIDNVRLTICPKCDRAICTDIKCTKCHCGTEWKNRKR